MPEIHRERMTVEIDAEMALIILGMRINNFLKITHWLPALRGMRIMIRELERDPALGFIAAHLYAQPPHFIAIQYWRSFAALEDYAKSRSHAHLPAWQAFNRKGARSGAVGLWHETYLVKRGSYECIYNNMPAHGLGLAGRLLPIAAVGETARTRLAR